MTSTVNNRMRDLLALATLKRWNVVPTTKDQTVGEHTFRVAVISWEIVDRYDHTPTEVQKEQGRQPGSDINMMLVLQKAMSHDGSECLTGDLPSNFKGILRQHGVDLHKIEEALCPWTAQLECTTDEKAGIVVRIADKIESASWLSMYGAEGTRELVNELQLKAHQLCIEAEKVMPGMLQIGMEVAGEVWKNQWPVMYQGQKKAQVAFGRR